MVKVTLDVVWLSVPDMLFQKVTASWDFWRTAVKWWLLFTEWKMPVSSGPAKHSQLSEVKGDWCLVWLVLANRCIQNNSSVQQWCERNVQIVKPGDTEVQLLSAEKTRMKVQEADDCWKWKTEQWNDTWFNDGGGRYITEVSRNYVTLSNQHFLAELLL